MPDAQTILAILGALATLITAIVALIKHLKAGAYKASAADAEAIIREVATTVDKLKSLTTPAADKSAAMKELGAKLSELGLKEKLDGMLDDLGIDKGA